MTTYAISEYSVPELKKIVSEYVDKMANDEKKPKRQVLKEIGLTLSKMKKNDLLAFINDKVASYKLKLDMKPLTKEERKKNVPTNQIVLTDTTGRYKFKKLTEIKPEDYVDFETDCIFRGKKKLLEHQMKFSQGFFESNYSGAIAFHGVGTGKTLSAAVIANCYLDKYPANKIVFVAPAGLIANFQKELYSMYNDKLSEPDPKKYNPLTDPRYNYFSYEKFSRLRDPQSYCANSLLIVDEAHNLRSRYTMNLVDTGGEIISKPSNNVRGYKCLQCALGSTKILLLTGTPLVNSVIDIENLMAISQQKPEPDYNAIESLKNNVLEEDLYVEKLEKIGKFEKITKVKVEETESEKKARKSEQFDIFASYFNYKISIVENKEIKTQFPDVNYKYVFINMNNKEIELYVKNESEFRNNNSDFFEKKISKKKTDKDGNEVVETTTGTKSFYIGERRYANVLGDTGIHKKFKLDPETRTYSFNDDDNENLKVNYILNVIRDEPEYVVDGLKCKPKFIVYSNFLDYGSNVLSKTISIFNRKYNKNIKYDFINSTKSRVERDSILSKFNKRDDDLQVVFLSRAGAEGLSFKETRGVFILEPGWNQSLIDQVIARGVRAGSHKELPEKYRYVDAYCVFVSTKFRTPIMPLYLKYGGISCDYVIEVDGNKKKEYDLKNLSEKEKNILFKLDTIPEKKLNPDENDLENLLGFGSYSGNASYDLFEYAFLDDKEKAGIAVDKMKEYEKELDNFREKLEDNIEKNKKAIEGLEAVKDKKSDKYKQLMGQKASSQRGINDMNKKINQMTEFIKQMKEKIEINPEFKKEIDKNISSSKPEIPKYTIEPIDIKLLKMSAVKQHAINGFYHLIKNPNIIKKVEDFKNPNNAEYAEKLKEYMEKNNGKEMPYRERTKLWNEIYKNKKINSEMEKLNNKYFKKLTEYLQKKKTEYEQIKRLKNKDKEKEFIEKNKLFDRKYTATANFFPTPKNLINKMIEMSGLRDDKRVSGILCFEPTAGYGNIPAYIYDTANKELSFDLCEYLPENRNIINDILIKNNPSCRLLESNDFFKLLPNRIYDYIFTNPPFDISYTYEINQKIEIDYDKYLDNKKKLIKDTAFIMRAYNLFLKEGGILCGVMSRSWMTSNDGKDFKDWIKDKIIDAYLVESGAFGSSKADKGALSENLTTTTPTIIIVLKKPLDGEILEELIDIENLDKMKNKTEIKLKEHTFNDNTLNNVNKKISTLMKKYNKSNDIQILLKKINDVIIKIDSSNDGEYLNTLKDDYDKLINNRLQNMNKDVYNEFYDPKEHKKITKKIENSDSKTEEPIKNINYIEDTKKEPKEEFKKKRKN
jgi:hypothetical protein